jgi:hypothetical protein
MLSGLSTLFKGDLIFLSYEIIKPNDAFGKVMIENLLVILIIQLIYLFIG